MKKQLGVTLSGLIMVSFVLILVLLLGFKLFQPCAEYFSIQKIFKTLAQKPEVRNGTKRDFIVAWAAFANIENISSIAAEDVEITHEGGNVVISASYTRKIPLFKNVTLLIDFNPSASTSSP